MDVDQLVKLIPGIGVSGVLILLVYGIMKGWLVTGREHSALQLQLSAMQAQMTSMGEAMQKLRDRDENQQADLNDLRSKLAAEQDQKVKAMLDVASLRNENATLKQQISELQLAVGQSRQRAANNSADKPKETP